MSPEEYELTDEQISDIFKNTNFGVANHRKLLACSILKRAAGYHCGHTITTIMCNIGMTTADNKPTEKGLKFCCDHFYSSRHGG